jgi:hypothetical protein
VPAPLAAPWVHVPGPDDLVMAVSVLFCVVLIWMQVRLIRRGRNGPDTLRWWAIVIAIYTIALRSLRIGGISEHSVNGVLTGEPVLLGYVAIMVAWAWKLLQ